MDELCAWWHVVAEHRHINHEKNFFCGWIAVVFCHYLEKKHAFAEFYASFVHAAA